MEKEFEPKYTLTPIDFPLQGLVKDLKQNTGPFCELKSGVTITMGGDGKSHEIPDELWKYIDIFAESYKQYKDSKWHNYPIYDAEIDMALAIWNDTYRKEKGK